MDTGAEFANGLTERMLGVKLPILMRMGFPGLLACAVLFRFVRRLLGQLPAGNEYLWERLVGFALLVLLLGAIVSSTVTQLTRIFGGRLFWPETVRRWAEKRQQARVDRLMREADDAAKAEDRRRYDEAWYKLRQYPIDEQTGKRKADGATRLGNIVAESDQYSWIRYGMDSEFYWGRIWLELDKDTRELIDGQWSLADGFLSMSAIGFVGAGIWLAQVILSRFGVGLKDLPFANRWLDLVGAVGWVALGYLWYRVSLPFQRANGELSKAVYDLYRHKIWSITAPKPNELASWKATWGYLQYHVLRCPNCGNWTELPGDACKVCKFGLAEVKRELEESGRLPGG
jgi:hypothetical protein